MYTSPLRNVVTPDRHRPPVGSNVPAKDVAFTDDDPNK
jgi:hypothetical protein